MRKVTVILFSILFCYGCQPLEQNARDVAASAQGFIETAQTLHSEECKANPGLQVCLVINSSVGAQNTLIDTIETYCGWTARPTLDQLKTMTGQNCQRIKTAQDGLRTSLTNLNAIMADLKIAANK